MARAIVGVIGGSGVYQLAGLTGVREERVTTPWGEPSDVLRFGRVGETQAVFLARHGQGHRFTPSTINYRANIDALKRAGVSDVIAVSACGSFREELFPGLFVLVDQFVDRTFARQTSFFGAGCVAHVPMAHPTSPLLRARVAAAAAAEGIACKNGGTYVCMEGPQFSTLAMVTDYDCWHAEHGPVDVASVLKVAHDNAERVEALLRRSLADFPAEHEACPGGADRALDGAIMTHPDARDPELMKKLEAIVARALAAAR